MRSMVEGASATFARLRPEVSKKFETPRFGPAPSTASRSPSPVRPARRRITD